MTETKLKIGLSAFFIAVLIPTIILVYQAHRQLRYETLHTQRVLVEELVGRINGELERLIQREEARSSAEYEFLVVEGTNFLQRSPISQFPVGNALPGLLSYFQVDASGDVSTPLVPQQENGSAFGITPREYSARVKLEEQVREVLIDAPSVPGDERKERDDAAVAGGFLDRLNEPARKASLGKVADLKLESEFANAYAESPEPASKVSRPRQKRVEQNLVPQGGRQNAQIVAVATFESAVDPLSFGVLDDDHFVLFRKVWRDDQRTVQGAVIQRAAFIESIKAPFLASALADVVDLVVALDDEVLDVVTRASRGGYITSGSELTGTLLYRARLPSPMDGIELIFSVRELPMAAGGSLVTWTAAVLFTVLAAAFGFMYRLGASQIGLNRQQRDFVSAVSHELKTPLTSIRMYGEILKAGWASEEKKRSYYDFIFEESERLSRLISNVLQLSRLTRNDAELDLQPMQVSELFDIIASQAASRIERVGFTLALEPGGDAEINVDTDAFTQVFVNLIDNAIKFSGKAATKSIEITSTIANGRATFSIRDFGPGIPRDQMKKIFRLFYRTERELTRETVGTGIGLALVHELVSAMHGEVDVVSRDPGVEFRIRIPLASV